MSFPSSAFTSALVASPGSRRSAFRNSVSASTIFPTAGVQASLTRIYNVYTIVSVDVTYRLQGQSFEWDAEKAATNLRTHHVSFEKACEVFFDPFVRLVDASDDSEAREAAMGLAEDWDLLFVVHVARHGHTIRVISARSATPSERRQYEHE